MKKIQGLQASHGATSGSNVETTPADPSCGKYVSLKPTMGLYLQRQRTTVLVAIGKICEGGSSIHNVTYADDVVRVSVDEFIEGDAEVPFPTSEIQYVKQALQTFIAWPKNLVKKVSHEVNFMLLYLLHHMFTWIYVSL